MFRTRSAVVAALTLLAATAGVRAALLAVDIDDRTVVDSPNNPPGFSSYVLPGTTSAVTAATDTTMVVNGYSVKLTPFDDGGDENLTTTGVQNTVGAIDDRDRATPVDGGSLTLAQVYDDVVFAGGSTGFTGGMDLTVSGGALQPNTPYLVSLYAFDSGSTGLRTANWLDANNANALVTTAIFDGSVLPTTDTQYKFTGLATTDATGALHLLGRNAIPVPSTGGVTPGVFLNGFEISDVPEPASLAACGLALLSIFSRRRRI